MFFIIISLSTVRRHIWILRIAHVLETLNTCYLHNSFFYVLTFYRAKITTGLFEQCLYYHDKCNWLIFLSFILMWYALFLIISDKKIHSFLLLFKNLLILWMFIICFNLFYCVYMQYLCDVWDRQIIMHVHFIGAVVYIA